MRVDRIGELFSALRQRVRNTEDSGKTRETSALAPGQAPPTAETLRGEIRSRISAVDSDAPDASQRRTRIFVEIVLARELGEGILQDPEFNGLVEGILVHIRSDVGLSTRLETLLEDVDSG